MSIFNGKPSEVIGFRNGDSPMMLRWFLFKAGRLPRIYLHKFLRSDDDRAPHDHPWWFISILLRGTYIEHINGGMKVRTAPSVAFRTTKDQHRVELLFIPYGVDSDHCYNNYLPTWSIIITGRPVRRWGFWCDKRFVPSREFEGC